MATALTTWFACTWTVAEPRIETVTPGFGWTGEATEVTVVGEHLVPAVRVEGGGGGVDVDDAFELWLADAEGGLHALSDVVAEDVDRVIGVVPEGLPPGLYGLVLGTPMGAEANLDSAFEVTATRADHFGVDGGPTFVVGDLGQIDVDIRTPDGQRLLESRRVALRLDVEEGDAAPEFTSGLIEAEVDGDGLGATGDLGDDGHALVAMRSDIPMRLTLKVSDEAGTLPTETLVVEFVPATVASVDVALPSDPFVAVAGEPFDVVLTPLDALGNVIDEVAVEFFLQSTCPGYTEEFEIIGPTTATVVLEVSTGTARCPQEALLVALGPDGGSLPFDVAGGPLAEFLVDAGPSVITAGSDLSVAVAPADAFGNVVPYLGELSFDDGGGGLGPAVCALLGSGVSNCDVPAFRADPAVFVTVTGDGDVTGTGGPVGVLPNPEVAEVAIEAPIEGVAGEAFELVVRATDAYGNALSTGALDAAVTIDGAADACTGIGADLAGGWIVQCVWTVSGEDIPIAATVDGVASPTVVIDLAHGPLADIVVTAPPVAVAGTELVVTLAAFDAYGNPTGALLDPVVDLADDAGSMLASSVSLDGEGLAVTDVVFTQATLTRIVASQGGVGFGESGDIDVVAGPATALSLDVEAPWAWTGTSVVVRVEIVDAFGNRTKDSAGDGVVTSPGAGATGFAVVNGVGAADLEWIETGRAVIVEASVGTWTGVSEPIDVVSDCGVAGPLPDMHFGGVAHGIACLMGPTASIFADLGDSLPGLVSIDRWSVALGDAPAVVSASPEVEVVTDSVGVYSVLGLASDPSGCGAQVEAVAYVGLDDGSVTGPIPVGVADDEVSLGDVTTVTIDGATDCAGDSAVGAAVLLRVDRGALVGTAPTGSGLQVNLDATGKASATWSMAGVSTGGDSRVFAWVPNGSAIGEGGMAVLGDDLRPTVWSQDPVGATETADAVIDVVFSEPMMPVVEADVEVVVGASSLPIDSVEMDASGTVLTVVLGIPVVGSSEVAFLTLADTIRDSGGLRLDGTWTGVRSTYVAAWGALAEVGATACAGTSPTEGVFRPDGDDGPGAESDEVALDVSADVVPSWWVLTVTNGAGEVVQDLHILPSSAADTLIWDGRDGAAAVLPNGPYTLSAQAADGVGGRGAGCSAIVTIDNGGGS